MRRHVTKEIVRTSAENPQLSPTRPLALPLHAPISHKASRGLPIFTTKMATCMVITGFLLLIVVHFYLAQVLLRNEPRLLKEFSFPVADDAERESTERVLTPLRPLDHEMYTIRINSWKRVEQLETSIQHHATCPGVAQIQVVWCDDQGDPPPSLNENPKVSIERHAVNSLNERFHILEEPPTLGILSMDDDVLRPCEAIDAGFFKWVNNPERMVGFDARSHSVAPNGTWSYAYLSVTEKTNQYSITLPRYSFIHRDYLNWYMTDVPRPIFNAVQHNFNCEDIAMSFFVSSLTEGQPPLLADKWASRWSQIKLYSKAAISDGNSHKVVRDKCVDDFSTMLGLKGKLHTTVFEQHGYFDCGAKGRKSKQVHSERQQALIDMRASFTDKTHSEVVQVLAHMKSQAGTNAYEHGLVPDTDPWKKRWNLKSTKKKKKKKKS